MVLKEIEGDDDDDHDDGLLIFSVMNLEGTQEAAVDPTQGMH